MPDEWYAQHVKRLLIRDEKDVTKPLGQRVRDTYELADAFIAKSPGRDSSSDAARLIKLLFGSPFETPNRHEQAMYMCSGASFRSSDAGRQVGAVVVDRQGEIVVTGVNEVPKPNGGQYWVDDKPDFRDFRIGYDENARQKLSIITDLIQSLRDHDWLKEEFAVKKPEELARAAVGAGGPLSKNRIGDLLEFARVAHAEMAAICTAARRGVPLSGYIMYTTTYPCHECARLIIAAGISRVIYVDPYPKSQVRAMYAHEVVEATKDTEGAISFEPFHGIAPRLYRSVFRMTGRSRDSVTGEYGSWDPQRALPRLVAEAQILNNVVASESQFYEPVYDELTHVDWRQIFAQAFTN
jgi:deoxycytidylate deaminase